MRSKFCGKRIAFLGDSLFHHGHFIDYLRAHFDGRADKPLLFNRGLGGNTAEMVEALLSDEILSLRPDYCFVAFGANDVGGWLYDEASEVTEEVLRDRAERDRIHTESMRRTAVLLREAGITPILCTTIAFNELIVEDKDIETLADNKEKGEKIKSTLYTKRAFQSINNTFRRYREALIETAKDTGSELCDLFKKAVGNDRLNVVMGSFQDGSVPVVLSASEESRRMEDMMRLYRLSGGEGDEMPSMLDETLTLNAASPLIGKLDALRINDPEAALGYATHLYRLAVLSQRKMSAEEMQSFLADCYRMLTDLI